MRSVALADVDVLLVVGTAAIRQYPYVAGSLLPDGTRLFVLTEDAAEANRSPAQLAVVGDLTALLDAVTEQVPPVTLQALVPVRRPLGFVSAAMGGLGFVTPAGIGFKLGPTDRPVIVVVGDGSSMYSIQSLWSAAQESAGVLFLVLANGGYAIMDR